MICSHCGHPDVIWSVELTHTECQNCGGVDCQAMVEVCETCNGEGLIETTETPGLIRDVCPDCDGTGEGER